MKEGKERIRVSPTVVTRLAFVDEALKSHVSKSSESILTMKLEPAEQLMMLMEKLVALSVIFVSLTIFPGDKSVNGGSFMRRRSQQAHTVRAC